MTQQEITQQEVTQQRPPGKDMQEPPPSFPLFYCFVSLCGHLLSRCSRLMSVCGCFALFVVFRASLWLFCLYIVFLLLFVLIMCRFEFVLCLIVIFLFLFQVVCVSLWLICPFLLLFGVSLQLLCIPLWSFEGF